VALSLHIRGVRESDGTEDMIILGASSQGVAPKQLPALELVLAASDVAAAVAEGFRLQAALAIMPGAALGPDDALAVEPASGAAAMGCMLNGPFCDAAIRAGGAEFPAHRVVLAAASPVFLSMLSSSPMKEARDAAVELRGADPAAVARLVAHMYGQRGEVPVSGLVALHALADQYQLRSGLAWRLLVELSTARLAPAALCALLPAAHSSCWRACETSLYGQAAEALAELVSDPAFALWPFDCLAAVVARAPALTALRAATAWVAAQAPAQGQQSDWWPRLLACAQLGDAALEDLRELWGSYGSTGLPGLSDALVAPLLALGEKAEKAVVQSCFTIVDQKRVIEQQEQQIAEMDRRIVELRSHARRSGWPV
jgi:hypothetical protein